MDMASTDHKFYYPNVNNPRTVDFLERMILVIHSLPGYFMCIHSPIGDVDLFMVVKRGGRSFHLVGLKNVVDYVNTVLESANGRNIRFEDVRAVNKALGVDPGCHDFTFKQSDDNKK